MDFTYINEDFNGAVLPADFVNNSATYTVSGGFLNLTGASGGLGVYVRSNKGVLSEKCRFEALYKCNSLLSGSKGIMIGTVTANTSIAHSMQVGLITDPGDANFGKIWIKAFTLGADIFSTETNTDISADDQLKIILRRDQLKVIVTAQNITKSWTISHEVQTEPTGAPFVTPNAGYPTIFHFGGSISVDSFKYIVEVPANLEKLFIGDSITYGQAATTQENRWINLVGTQANNIGMGGGGDTTASVVSHLAEIVAILNFAISNGNKPIVYVMIGGNDLLFGIDISVVEANLITIRNAIVSTGASMVHLLTTPRAGASQVNDVIRTTSNFDLDGKIDINTPLRGTDENTLAGAYAGDSVHPNTAGNALMAATINAAAPFNVVSDQPNIIIPKVTIDFTTAGLSSSNVFIIYRVGNPLLSWMPGRLINGITGFEAGKGYYIIGKKDINLIQGVPPLP